MSEYALELLKSVASFILPLILGYIAGFIKTQFFVNNKQNAMLRALGQYRLMRNCERYLLRGHITVEEFTILENIYAAYHALGGEWSGGRALP